MAQQDNKDPQQTHEERGRLLRKSFECLNVLTTRERFVFIERRYFQTKVSILADILHMNGEAVLEILYKAEEKLNKGSK